MLDKENQLPDEPQSDSVDQEKAKLAPLTFDLTAYSHHLADSDLTEEQQQELLRTLWEILVQFVDLGFRIGPDQAHRDNSKEEKSSLAPRFQDVLKSKKNRKINKKNKLRRAPKCEA